MEKRHIIFWFAVTAVLLLNALTWAFLDSRREKPLAQNQPAQAGKPDPDKAAKPVPVKKDDKPVDRKAELRAADEHTAADEDAKAPPTPRQWVTLGSADPDSPYRMLVTLTNEGAAIERLELNSPRYKDIDDWTGYLGHLSLTNEKGGAGCRVHVVGPGTPAALAGLKPEDVIQGLDDVGVANVAEFEAALHETKPKQVVKVSVRRDGKPLTLPVTLVRRPLEVMRPEKDTARLNNIAGQPHDPLPMLVTLEKAGDLRLGDAEEELPGVDLRSGNWEVVKADATTAVFRKRLPKLGLEVRKHYGLARVAPDEDDARAYHLTFAVEIVNTGQNARTVAYRLDGPNGLPTEGAWFATKVGRNWRGGVGLRDLLVRFEDNVPTQLSATTIATAETQEKWMSNPLSYIAVDAQYFAAAVLPEADPGEVLFEKVTPLRVGDVPADTALLNRTNISFRLTSKPEELEPDARLRHEMVLFAGPKKNEVLANYGSSPATLEDLNYYGWFGWVARPMLWLLHTFYALVRNYGVAIIMLTILVRGCMFPLSRKQALSAQKMQELQPEMKRIAEKYKKNVEQRTKAQQELFRKHNYNPLGGCLLVFIQLPIFVGLYKSLTVAVELRQAPLISDAIRWCSNLAAPDMLLDWSGFMPEFITRGTGIFGLGPYLNILPLVTIALFLWQQKMFMPPPADEQAAMQQKMMQYMMIFMGIMFFKVPSGLCIYFIASSLWGIAERKLLPKTIAPPASDAAAQPPVKPAAPAASNGSGGKSGKKKHRERK